MAAAFVSSSGKALNAGARRPRPACAARGPRASAAAGAAGISRRAALAAACAGAAGLLAEAPAARADHTYVAAKRAFERYYPRIVAGVDQVREVRGIVAGADGSVAAVVDSRVFDVKLRRALSIYATSFSDNYLGERSRDLLRSVDVFYREMAKVKGAAEGDCVEHYNKAVDALQEYFEVARLDSSVVKGLEL